MKLELQLQTYEASGEGCFRVVDKEATPTLLGHISVADAQTVADHINIQLMAAEQDEGPFRAMGIGEDPGFPTAPTVYEKHEREM